MQRPDVSVVVIVYNDASRLPAAVRSITEQTLRNLEIIVVDDCSTDGSGQVARQLAAHDHRLRVISLDRNSGGCSLPRNVGLAHARAPFVLFVDSDDTYERHACKNLLLAAEKHNADVVVGMTRRYRLRNGRVEHIGEWYRRLHHGHQVYNGIRENPDLLFHSLATDKLYRVELLNRHEIRFPAGLLYEDLLFNAKVLAHARTIAVIPNLVHRWMVDTGSATPSITHQRADIRNFEHRIAIMRQIDAFLDDGGHDDLKLAKDVKFVRHDLRLYLDDLPRRDPDYQERFVQLAGEYLRTVEPQALSRSGVVQRIACHMLMHGDLHQTLKALDYLRHNRKLSADLVRRDGRIYWCDPQRLPAESEPALDVTSMHWHMQPLRERRLYHQVTSLDVRGSLLRLEVSLANPLGQLPVDVIEIELGFRHRRSTARRFVPVSIDSADADRILYTTVVDVDELLPVHRPGRSSWRVSARVRVGEEVNYSSLTVLHPGLEPVDGMAAEITPARRPLLGTRLVCRTTSYGNLAFDLVYENSLARTAARQWRRSRRLPPLRAARRRTEALRTRLASDDLKTQAYRHLQRLPVKKGSVVFESHMGRQYSDNPKYVYEALRRSGIPHSPVWSYRSSPDQFPREATLVKRGSWRYFYELARAEYWCDNHGFPRHVAKRPGTTYLQTWHGTPLKLMGWDEPRLARLPAPERRAHEAMIERWDALIAPNEYFVDTFVSSYNFTGRLLRCGSPRNDRLVTDNDPATITALKVRLGLPLDRRIVLYAPTFRPRDDRSWVMALALQLGEMEQELALDHFVLARSHYFDSISIPDRFAHFARSVSNHHDVTDLLLVADVLITDYSSVMFDYANLERPMIFFAYDYDEYLLHRGTYLDLHAIAPGPVVTTTEEVVKCLQDLDVIAAAHGEALAAFRQKFGQYEQGSAADAVVAAIFAPQAAR